MARDPRGPEWRLRQADEVLAAATDRILGLLREAVADLDPFPPFPGAFFTMAIEVEPDGIENKEVGCVVVTEGAELKELQIGIDEDSPLGNDPVSTRNEALVDLELSAHDRFVLAYNGLRAVGEVLGEQRAARERSD